MIQREDRHSFIRLDNPAESPRQKSLFDSMPSLLGSRPAVYILVMGHMFFFGGGLYFCWLQESIDKQYGAAWEFWVGWLHVGMTIGIVEVMVKLYRREEVAPMTYPKAMLM